MLINHEQTTAGTARVAIFAYDAAGNRASHASPNALRFASATVRERFDVRPRSDLGPR